MILVLGPLATILVVRALGLTGPVANALVVLSVTGTVPLAPKFVAAAKGDVAFCVLLMFLLGMVTVVTAAPSAKWLLGYEGEVPIHPWSLIAKLVFLQGLPLAIGWAVRQRSTKAAQLERIVHHVNVAALVVVLALVIAPRLGSILAIGWRGLLAAVIVALAIAGLGWLLGGQARATRVALAAMANPPNVGLALIMAQAAGARPALLVAIVGVFLVRALVGLALQKLLARRAVAVVTELRSHS